MPVFAPRKSLLLLTIGVPLILGGCATRQSVEQAQASANLADQHAGAAKAQADQATSIGQNALGQAQNAQTGVQTVQQRQDAMEASLKSTNARLAHLSHSVVYKKVRHHKRKHKMHHHAAKKPSGS